MITYELCILFRIMPKNELVTALKRTAGAIFDKGGIIRKLENLGTRDMPYKTSVHGVVHNKASYFLMEFNVPPKNVEDFAEECSRDVDVIRNSIYKKLPEDNFECTLEEELQPPPYRKSVIELMDNVKKTNKKKEFNYGPGLDYYPFQK